MKNDDKALLLRLLTDERFRICQHRIKVLEDEGTDLVNWMTFHVNQINDLIAELDLSVRVYTDPAESLPQSIGEEMESMNAIIDGINDKSCDLKEVKHRLHAIMARQSLVLKKAGF